MRAKFVLNESRDSVIELIDLTRKITKEYNNEFQKVAIYLEKLNEKNVKSKQWNIPISSIIKIDISSEGFNVIKDFIENTVFGILPLFFLSNKTSAGSYLAPGYIRELNQNNIYRFGKEEDLEILKKFPSGVILLYSQDETTLLHELQHVYDWYISKEKISTSRQYKKLMKLKLSGDKSPEANKQYMQNYSNAYYENYARIAEFIKDCYNDIENDDIKSFIRKKEKLRGDDDYSYMEYMDKNVRNKLAAKKYLIYSHIEETIKKIENFASKGELSKIKQLVEEDKNNTRLFTLDALQNAVNNNHNAVAKYLVDHRNTSYKKLKKVEEYMGTKLGSVIFNTTNDKDEILKNIKKWYSENTKEDYYPEKFNIVSALIMCDKYHKDEWFNFLYETYIKSGEKKLNSSEINKILTNVRNREVQTFLLKEIIKNKNKENYDIALYLAAKLNHTDAIKYLIDAGANSNKEHEDYYFRYTPLEKAVENNNTKAVKILLDNSKKLKKEDRILKDACRYANAKIVKMILDAGVKVNFAVTEHIMGYDTKQPLEHACIKGDFEIVKLLLSRGADINIGDPLYYAIYPGHDKPIYTGHTDIAKLLINAGVKVNGSHLAHASMLGNIEIVKMLLDKDADIHYQKDLPIRWAAKEGRHEVVKILNDYLKKKGKL